MIKWERRANNCNTHLVINPRLWDIPLVLRDTRDNDIEVRIDRILCLSPCRLFSGGGFVGLVGSM